MSCRNMATKSGVSGKRTASARSCNRRSNSSSMEKGSDRSVILAAPFRDIGFEDRARPAQRSGEPGFDRAGWQAEGRRHLPFGEVEQIAHGNHLAVAGVEKIEGIGKRLIRFPGQGQCLRSVFRRWIAAVRRVIELDQGVAKLRAQPVARLIS